MPYLDRCNPNCAGQELGRQVVEPADGTLNHLGEEGDKEKKFGEVLLWRVLVPVDVDDVAHRLEQKKEMPRGRTSSDRGIWVPGRSWSARGWKRSAVKFQYFST